MAAPARPAARTVKRRAPTLNRGKLRYVGGRTKGLLFPGTVPNSGWTVYNADYKKSLSKQDKLVILPIEFHGFPVRNKVLLEIVIFAGMIATWGRYGMSLQPVRKGFPAAGFGNMNWQLSHAVHHLVSKHSSVQLDRDRCRPWVRPMATALPKLLAWSVGALKAVGAPVPSNFQPCCFLLAHVDKYAVLKGGKQMRYRVVAAIVNGQTKQIIAATSYHQIVDDKKAAYVASLGGLGKWMLKAFKPVFKSAP